MQQNVLQIWAESEWPNPRASQPLPTGEGVLDSGAFNAIEIDELFDHVNHASTVAGQTVLYRSLARPLADLEAIAAKQDAVREIRDNPAVRDNIEQILQQAGQEEERLHLLLFGEFVGTMGTAKERHQIEGYGYKQYRRAMAFVNHVVGAVQSSGNPETPYLRSIYDKIRSFADSNDYALMTGPVYNSEKGLQSKQEWLASMSPAMIFRPHLFKPLLIVLVFAALWLASRFISLDFFNFGRDGLSIGSVFLFPLLLAYIPVIGGYDRDHCILPLRDRYRNSQALGEMLEGLGQLDELMAFIRYGENYGSATVLPELLQDEQHQLSLRDAKNPILGNRHPDYVGNELTIDRQRLVCVTGPNSGGKTAFCKTLVQIQVLAQIGCYVPAQAANLSVADHVFYQAPEISHLDDGEGRFGTELKRTRDIFLASTSRSLVVLDEMAEGTTFEEKMQSSIDVLDGFYRKGNTTILITHNHQLACVRQTWHHHDSAGRICRRSSYL